MLDVYKIASLPKLPPALLGRQLHPLTLGMVNLLMCLDSPFIAGGAADISDLVQGIILCSYPDYETARSAIQSDGFRTACIELAGAAGPVDLQKEVNAFSEHVAYWTRAPRRMREGAEKPLAVPWPWALVQALEEYRRISREEAWNTSCVDAFCQFWAAKTMHGDESVMSEQDVAFEDQVEEEARAEEMKKAIEHAG